MAPTLNCTVGDPAANSYVCLDEAEEIARQWTCCCGAEWIALSEEDEGRFKRWIGIPTSAVRRYAEQIRKVRSVQQSRKLDAWQVRFVGKTV